MYAYDPSYEEIEFHGAPTRFKGPFCESDHYHKPPGKLRRHRWKGCENGPFPTAKAVLPPSPPYDEDQIG